MNECVIYSLPISHADGTKIYGVITDTQKAWDFMRQDPSCVAMYISSMMQAAVHDISNVHEPIDILDAGHMAIIELVEWQRTAGSPESHLHIERALLYTLLAGNDVLGGMIQQLREGFDPEVKPFPPSIKNDAEK